MQSELLHYQADGIGFEGQLFLPPGPGIYPGVLVFPEAFGIGPYSLHRARQLAELGFAVLAGDLHGGGRHIPDLAEAMAAVQPLFDDPLRMRARALAAFAALAARPEVDAGRIAAIGYCFPMPLELARSGAALKATIGFHTSLATRLPARPGTLAGSILVCIGSDDPFISAADRAGFEAEMRAAGADWQLQILGNTVHSFTNPAADRQHRPDAIRYSAAGDRQSWRAMMSLLDQTLS